MNYRNQSDETLVLLTLAGEKEAFEELVIRHRNTVIAAAASVTHNHFMAEDASQDAFVTAWMKLDTLAEPSKFLSWVCKIAIFCAKNTVRRYRPFAPIEDVEKYGFAEDYEQDPASLYAISEEKEELHRTVLSLPERVRRVITLHYFEELTVAEIAEQMNISVGTVKSQLHEGRKRLRKELCAMNEKANDTLVERVMKKVEEIKLWQIRNDKSGFDAVYSGILAEVEDLPESKNKYHALADVLARGWWWLPGKKNETLFSRIKEAALIGKNDEIMRFIILREGYKQSESRRADFIRNEQIPELERAGFVGALAFARLRLGYRYLMDKKYDESLFKDIRDFMTISVNGLHISLMHYPMLSWPRSHYGSIMLHGHIHSDTSYNISNREAGIKRYDVGVDANGYFPVSIEEVKEFVSDEE